MIILPIYLTLPRKTKKDKSISLNLNWYRNVNFIVNNQVKKLFLDTVSRQLRWLKYEWEIELHYKLYWKRISDLDNWQAVVTKYFQDSLVECRCIEDDNFNFIKKNVYEVIEKDMKNPRFEVEILPYKH